MSEIKHVLEEQLEREKNSALKQLTTSNLDAMYKITTTLCNLEKMEHGDIAETVVMQERILLRSTAMASMIKI